MSRVSKAPPASDRKRLPVEGGPRIIRPPIVACAAALCALAAPGFLSARTEGLFRPDPSNDTQQTAPPGRNHEDSTREPKIRIEASTSVVNVCPDREGRARVSLGARGASAECRPRYSWRVTGGHVEGVGADVVWNLDGASPGREFYEATVTVEAGASCASRRSASATWRVVAGRCPPRVTS